MPAVDQRLTDHFWLSEFTGSQTAARMGVANQPNGAQLDNLARVATLLEEVRTTLGNRPITISSGFRSAVLNAAVGGAHDSAHLYGRAADFICPSFGTPKQICLQLMRYRLEWDQLICEGTWVHLGLATLGARPRGQVLTAAFAPGETTTYHPGLVA